MIIFLLSVQDIKNSRQSFQNSPSVRAQITLNAEDVCFNYERERGQNNTHAAVSFHTYFLLSLVSWKEAQLSVPSRPINWPGKSLKQVTGSQHMKNPQIFSLNLENTGLSHYFGSKHPLVYLL